MVYDMMESGLLRRVNQALLAEDPQMLSGVFQLAVMGNRGCWNADIDDPTWREVLCSHLQTRHWIKDVFQDL